MLLRSHPRCCPLCPSLLVLALALGSCGGCAQEAVPCDSSAQCPADQVCAQGYCRQVCNSASDCAEGERCSNGACVPGAEPERDAAQLDRATADLSALDAAQPDAARPDAAPVDSAHDDTVAADRPAADSAPVDAAAPDTSGLELAAPDASAPDREALDTSAPDRAAPDTSAADTSPTDLGLPDAWPNQAPSLAVAVEAEPTYPSSQELSFPTAAQVVVDDPEDDSPYTLSLVGGDPGCGVSGLSVVYTPAPGFTGLATCTVVVTDSGGPPATSAPIDVAFEVMAPYVSCYWIKVDVKLASMGIGEQDGRYLIDPDGAGGAPPFDAHCDMSTSGGGWTLALRARSREDVRSQGSFWTDPSHMLSADPSPRYGASAKYQPFNVLAFSELLVGMVAESDLVDPNDPNDPGPPGVPSFNVLQLDISGASLLDTFVQGDFISTPWSQRDREAWLALLPGATLQPNCSLEGLSFLPNGGSRPFRIGISANNEVHCDSNDSFLGVGTNEHQDNDIWVGVVTTFNEGDESAIPAFAVVFVRDARIVTQTVRSTCMGHRLAGETVSGLYPIHPGAALGERPLVSHCEMGLFGGGWTLLATNGDSGQWSNSNVLDATVFGTASLTDDFKSHAFGSMAMDDLLIRSAAPSGRSAVYEGVGAGIWSLGRRLAEVGASACVMHAPNAFHPIIVDFDSADLCERTLFFSPQDQEGTLLSCQNDDNAFGPAWSTAGNSGCPLDDPADSAFITPLASSRSPFAPDPTQIWARQSDFTSLGAADSCQAHRDAGHTLSGTYLVTTPDAGVEPLFCFMTVGGQAWTRVVKWDRGHMEGCPGDWQPHDQPRVCWRDADEASEYIRSASFEPWGLSYHAVRGYLRGTQKGTSGAFRLSSGDIESSYVDGVSITHGPPGSRAHIWTYAFAGQETPTSVSCPCTGGEPAPDFVDSDYYCDHAGYDGGGGVPEDMWFTDNLLFDDIMPSPCYSGGDPAWFETTLPADTSDAIEVRLMSNEPSSNEGIALVAIELYVR